MMALSCTATFAQQVLIQTATSQAARCGLPIQRRRICSMLRRYPRLIARAEACVASANLKSVAH